MQLAPTNDRRRGRAALQKRRADFEGRRFDHKGAVETKHCRYPSSGTKPFQFDRKQYCLINVRL